MMVLDNQRENGFYECFGWIDFLFTMGFYLIKSKRKMMYAHRFQ